MALLVTLGGGKRSWRGRKEAGDCGGGWVGEQGGEVGGDGGGSGSARVRLDGGVAGVEVEVEGLVAAAAGESCRLAADCAADTTSASIELICLQASGTSGGGAPLAPELAAVLPAATCTTSAGTAGSAGSTSALSRAGGGQGDVALSAAFLRPFGRFRLAGAFVSAPAAAASFAAATEEGL